MDINWLGDFACLARTLNFTRAAEERNITQSAFSRRIKSLENWLGVPLIQRSSYPVQLTANPACPGTWCHSLSAVCRAAHHFSQLSDQAD